MIAAEFQGRGFGEAALKLWLEKVRTGGRHDRVILCYVRETTGRRTCSAASVLSRLALKRAMRSSWNVPWSEARHGSPVGGSCFYHA